MPEEKIPEWIWCIVGNVVEEHPYGNDHRLVRGTKHFTPGTKVYCLPGQWGDGYERIPVVGKPRGKRGFIRVVMNREYIENFRIKKVFSPSVIKSMYYKNEFQSWGNSDEDYQTIKGMLTWLNYSKDEWIRAQQLRTSEEIILTSRLIGHAESETILRIEHRMRTDGKVGGAWYGSYRFGTEAEESLGVIDWYSHWPESEPDYDWHNHKFSHDFIDGICDIGIQSWNDSYDSPSNNGGPLYTWRLEVKCDESHGYITRGQNCCPEELPQLYHLLKAWGFPAVWNSRDNAPTAHLQHFESVAYEG